MPRKLSEWQDEIAKGLLEDLEELTGEKLKDWQDYPVYEEPEQGEELDIDSEAGGTQHYFEMLFDDLDVDPGEEDSYGDEGN